MAGDLSPFGKFVKICHEARMKSNPNQNQLEVFGDVSRDCAEKWKLMTEAEKLVYCGQYISSGQDESETFMDASESATEKVDQKGKKRTKKASERPGGGVKKPQRSSGPNSSKGYRGEKKGASGPQRDPKAPKGPMSTFYFFCFEKRKELLKAHPDWTVEQLAPEVGRMWKQTSAEEKAIYAEMSARDKARYQTEMQYYNAAKNFENGVPKRDGEKKQEPEVSCGNMISEATRSIFEFKL